MMVDTYLHALLWRPARLESHLDSDGYENIHLISAISSAKLDQWWKGQKDR
jgi:hypothetical protein